MLINNIENFTQRALKQVKDEYLQIDDDMVAIKSPEEEKDIVLDKKFSNFEENSFKVAR